MQNSTTQPMRTKDAEQLIRDASDIVIELDGDIETVVTAHLSKNRFGPTARFDLVFDPETGTLTEVRKEGSHG